MIRIPLLFVDLVDTNSNSVSRQSVNDFRHLIHDFGQQKDVDYLVNLNLEFHCNRNRNDDVFPILNTFSIANTDVNVTKQMLLNCDTRNIYNSNNMIIPYNLRYWVPPKLIDIERKVNIESNMVVLNSDQLVKMLRGLVTVEVLQGVIINHENSYLEFIIQWDGFRYYITKYYWRSLCVGVFMFYMAALSQVLFYNMVLLVSTVGGQDRPRDKAGSGLDLGLDEDSFNYDRGHNYNYDSGPVTPAVKSETSEPDLHRVRVKQETDEI